MEIQDFFHTSTMIRRRSNKIESLRNSERRWIEGREGLQSMAVEFYEQLFKSDPTRGGVYITGHFPSMPQEQKDVWNAGWTESEVKKALGGMGSWKSPGPDGYQPGFFKRTWEPTGGNVLSFVQDVLGGGEVTDDDAEALLVLVPNETRPSSLRFFAQ